MSSIALSRLTIILILGLTLSAYARSRVEEPRYWIVVHPENPNITLRRDEVSRLFLKKITRWSDGRIAEPVDLVEAAPARDAFSRDVHGRPASVIKKYWQRMVFSGESAPPPEVASEEDVLELVRKNPAAIGYVSDEVTLRGVKIVDIVVPPKKQSGKRASPAH